MIEIPVVWHINKESFVAIIEKLVLSGTISKSKLISWKYWFVKFPI